MGNSRKRETAGNAVRSEKYEVKEPYRLQQDGQREYISLDVAGPITYAVLKDRTGGYWPGGDGAYHSGIILDISPAGVLLSGDTPLEAGTLLLLNMKLQNGMALANIVGLVKKNEGDGKEWLLGIELVSRSALSDILSNGELDLLKENVTTLDEKLNKVLAPYVHHKRISAGK